MTRQRNRQAPENGSHPPREEAATSLSLASTEAAPESHVAKAAAGSLEAQISCVLNTNVNGALRDLLKALVPQACGGERVCVSTRGTVQHIADSDRVYVLDYDVRVDYRCITGTTPREGSTD